jgi:3-oxoacyl-[acyl-carrier protein] reductase
VRQKVPDSKRTVLVTGASRGIGAAIAEVFSQHGWDVVRPGRDELDLANAVSVHDYCRSLKETAIDALVNNAGVNHLASLTEIDEAKWDEMLRVNLTAMRMLTEAVVPGMSVRSWGRIVNVSSIFSLVARSKRAAYAATKGAVNAFTRAAAVELAPRGILVNAVCPGYIGTDMTRANNSVADLEAIERTIPLSRLGDPLEIARVVAFLCSDEASYITGQLIVADGGFTCQ